MEYSFISVQPDDLQFLWQLRTQLHNFRSFGYSSRYRILLFTPYGRVPNTQYYELANEFPEAQFFFYVDAKNECSKLMSAFNYIPLLRPWTLKQHFKNYPELEQQAIFYLDSDVVFTKKLEIEQFLQDDICYLSFTGNKDRTDNYISASYFDKKEKDVLPRKLESYRKRDILAETTKLIGIDRATCELNEAHTGGAQYLLKGINAKFWANVLDGCMLIKTHLSAVNQKFFSSENKGFQSWCADMWALLWNLWKLGKQTRCPKELDFAWATDPISRWDEVYLYHDAGATYAPVTMDGEAHWCFNKRGQRVAFPDGKILYLDNYSTSDRTPYEDDLSWVSPKMCSYNYTQLIKNSQP